MTDNEYCQLVSILIPKYVKGQCTKAEGGLLGEHCAVCQECRTKLVWACQEAQQIRPVKEDLPFLLSGDLKLSQKEILFLSHPRNLRLSKNLGSKEKKQEANNERDFVIDWKDSVLESRMRDNIGIFFRKLSYKDVKDITELDLSSSGSEKISDISALSGLTNLNKLLLRDNQISDISALSSLTNLKDLDLNDNQISDISALSSLTNLNKLSLWYNQISDISVLSSLTNLNKLLLWHNQISNISSLSSLTKLEELDLSGNQISDISALSSLTNLKKLDLRQNEIRDYKPIEHLKTCVVLK